MKPRRLNPSQYQFPPWYHLHLPYPHNHRKPSLFPKDYHQSSPVVPGGRRLPSWDFCYSSDLWVQEHSLFKYSVFVMEHNNKVQLRHARPERADLSAKIFQEVPAEDLRFWALSGRPVQPDPREKQDPPALPVRLDPLVRQDLSEQRAH